MTRPCHREERLGRTGAEAAPRPAVRGRVVSVPESGNGLACSSAREGVPDERGKRVHRAGSPGGRGLVTPLRGRRLRWSIGRVGRRDQPRPAGDGAVAGVPDVSPDRRVMLAAGAVRHRDAEVELARPPDAGRGDPTPAVPGAPGAVGLCPPGTGRADLRVRGDRMAPERVGRGDRQYTWSAVVAVLVASNRQHRAMS